MPTIPATGTTWRGSGASNTDTRLNVRGGLAAVLIRMNRGAATNISPYRLSGGVLVPNWSPFALNGQLRADLFATVRVDGEWVTNPLPNEGFWLIGAMSEDGGPERAPNISQDRQMILQQNAPFDVSITEEGITISFTGVETLKPLLKRLRMNLSLSDSNGNPIVEDPGHENFVIGKPLDTDGPEYQIVLLFSKKNGGKEIFTAEGYALGKLSDIGSFRRSKTDPDAGSLSYDILPDPFMMIKDPNNPTSTDLIPGLFAEWTAGDGWTAIGGVPVFTATPTAVAGGTAGTATVTAQITGPDPFALTVESAATPFTAWTQATLGTVTWNGSTATIGVTGLTAGARKIRVKAKGSNGQTTTSPETVSTVTIT